MMTANEKLMIRELMDSKLDEICGGTKVVTKTIYYHKGCGGEIADS